MDLKLLFFGALLYLYQFQNCYTETVTYINVEHPSVTWYDKKYYNNFTLASQRISRQDPSHYVNLYLHTLMILGNNVQLDFYFYQFLTNRYRPSFVEMHFKFCDMLSSDSFFGTSLQRAFQNKTCPFPPGVYHLQHMTVSFVPKGFPFAKGRIYCNITIYNGNVARLIGSGYINMEVKVARLNIKREKTKL